MGNWSSIIPYDLKCHQNLSGDKSRELTGKTKIPKWTVKSCLITQGLSVANQWWLMGSTENHSLHNGHSFFSRKQCGVVHMVKSWASWLNDQWFKFCYGRAVSWKKVSVFFSDNLLVRFCWVMLNLYIVYLQTQLEVLIIRKWLKRISV